MRYTIDPSTVAALRTWSAQKRALYIEFEQPVPSLLGKIKAQQSAAGEGDARLRQKWPEVYTGDGLVVETIVQTVREMPRLVVTYYYVLSWPWRVEVAAQARDLGIRTRDYWRQLELAELAVETGLKLLGKVRTPSTPRETLACDAPGD